MPFADLTLAELEAVAPDGLRSELKSRAVKAPAKAKAPELAKMLHDVLAAARGRLGSRSQEMCSTQRSTDLSTFSDSSSCALPTV